MRKQRPSLFSNKFEEEIDSFTQVRKPIGIQEAIKTKLLKIGKAEGVEIGKAEGIEIGVEKGEEKALRFAISQLLLKGFEAEETAELLSVPSEMVQSVASDIATGNIPKLSSEEE